MINKDDEALDQEEEENVVDELPEKVDEILQVKHKASCNLIVRGNVDLIVVRLLLLINICSIHNSTNLILRTNKNVVVLIS